MRRFWIGIMLLVQVAVPCLALAQNQVVYEIQARTEDDDLPYLSRDAISPFSVFRPQPFFYKQDVDAAKEKSLAAFLMAGVNCDSTIRNALTLTGVRLEILSLRARGKREYGSYDTNYSAKRRPEWLGAGQRGMRSSSDGFIDKKYAFHEGESAEERAFSENALRDLLLRDNKIVRNSRLTHQLIAEPILAGIEGYIRNGRKIFKFNGHGYSIDVGEMGGRVELLTRNEDPVARRYKESGWTGRGVQGSFFNDELFSNVVYVFTDLNAAPGDRTTFSIDGLTPHLVYRYGFYQGGEFRASPESIMSFFSIKPKDGFDPWKGCN